MSSDTVTTIKPWYKYFWPWFLMLFPFAAVVAGIITIVLATKGHDDDVVVDYYKKGLAINRVITQQETAASMGLTADAVYLPGTGEVSLNLHPDSKPDIDSLSLTFVHATRADYDRHVLLHKDRQGVFRTKLKDIKPGHWQLILEPADKTWRLDARVVLPATRWQLRPNV